jgi:hypothetical protein
MSDTLVNKVAQSGLITLNLEDFYPTGPVKVFDLKGYLYMELILKEKEFREALKQTDWSAYQGAIVGIGCSADAIIPVWAYMLVSSYLQPIAKKLYMGDESSTIAQYMNDLLKQHDFSVYKDQRVVVKGCGEKPISEDVYVTVTACLRPLAQSIMYGEPCSTVPVYKKPKG